MAATTYWDSTPQRTQRTRTRRRRASTTQGQAAVATRRTTPWWLSAVIFTAIFGMLLVSINYRAFTEMRDEAKQNVQLQSRVQGLMDENLQLQEEIHSLKTDPQRIECEARRVGIDLAAVK